jgi:Flp pilus assembly protein TadG
MLSRPSTHRRGTSTLEFAVICPLTLTLLCGLVIGGLGVFRYQQVASLAREGARYASVHGAKYQSATGNAAATADDVYNNAIKPKIAGLDTNQLTYAVSWDPDNRQGGMVTVQLTYNWIPEAFLGGITLTSTAVMPVSY